MYTKQEQIAELAKRHPTMALTSLNHHLDLDWLREVFRRTRKNGAPGVDGQTWADYATNLDENLRSLLERAKSGSYRAPPVRRVWIPKGTGSETRPIGIPTLEDKVLQRSVVMILEAIYEQDFLDCSYGFRPGRSAHQALEALWQQTMRVGAKLRSTAKPAFLLWRFLATSMCVGPPYEFLEPSVTCDGRMGYGGFQPSP